MIVVFPPAVRARLEAIEIEEGIPALDLVHQAVEVWSHLNVHERQALGIVAMRTIVDRLKGEGDPS